MYNPQKNIIDNILLDVNTDRAESKVLLISGPPACGKSTVLEAVSNALGTSQSIDFAIHIENTLGANFISELFRNANAVNYSQKATEVALPETEFNFEQFNIEFDKIIENNPQIAQYYNDIYKLSSFAYQKENKKTLEIKAQDTAEYVREITSKKSIHRLMLEPNNTGTESLIVDLMNLFYPEITSGQIDGIRPSKPIKILITIDNCDSINESVNNLLFYSLLKYAYQAKFNEFTSYNIAFSDQSIKVSDFFDFRFIYASRSPITRKYLSKLGDYFLDMIKQIEIPYLKEIELQEMRQIIPAGLTPTQVIEMSGGIQGLIFNDLKELRIPAAEMPKELTKRAFDIIKGSIPEIHEDMLFCLAFGCNEKPSFNRKCSEIFDLKISCSQLLKYNLYLAKGNPESGLRHEYREIIQEYLKHNHPETYSNLLSISLAADIIPDIIDKYSDDEFNILVLLAFLPKENNLELARLALYKRLTELEELYNSNKPIFYGGKYQLDQKLAERIRNFVKSTDEALYEELTNIPVKYADRIEEERERIKTQKTAQILSYEKELKKLETNYSAENKEYKRHQEEMMKCENEMIQIRQQVNDKSHHNNILVSMISIFITISILIFGIILPKIFLADGPNSPVFSVQFILYTIVAVLCILDYIFLRRTIKSFKDKEINAQYIKQLEELDSEKNEYLSKMMECKGQMEQLQQRKKELNELINA